jgi:hypothetical protein
MGSEWIPTDMIARRPRLVLTILLALLTAACAGGVAPSPRPPHASRGRMVLVGWSVGGITGTGHEHISLLGAWTPERGWRRREDEDLLKLLPRGGTWVLYATGRSPVRVRTDRARETRGNNRVGYVSARLTTRVPLPPGMWVGALGARRARSFRVRLPEAARDRAASRILGQLRRQGYLQSREAALTQDIAVDLNRDGAEDRLLTVGSGLTASKTGPVDLVVAAIATRGGAFRLTILTKRAWHRMHTLSSFLSAKIVAVADINGDGRCEVALSLGGNDYAGLELYTMGSRGLSRVLYADDWAA